MAVFPRDFARFQSRSGIEASVCVLNPSKPLNLRRLTCDCPALRVHREFAQFGVESDVSILHAIAYRAFGPDKHPCVSPGA